MEGIAAAGAAGGGPHTGRPELSMHISTCSHVPAEIKSSLEELKALVKEYKSSVKRGAKKKFIEKVWRRMEELRIKSMMAEEHEGLLCIDE